MVPPFAHRIFASQHNCLDVGVDTVRVSHGSHFDQVVRQLNPHFVIFDRFIMVMAIPFSMGSLLLCCCINSFILSGRAGIDYPGVEQCVYNFISFSFFP
jgi:hypothetical protein